MNRRWRGGGEAGRPAGAAPNELRLSARVLFYELREDSIALDCVTSADIPLWGIDRLPAGQPFTIEVAMPGFGWLEAALATVERWAECDREVQVRAVVNRLGPRVRVSDSATVIQFDLLSLVAG